MQLLILNANSIIWGVDKSLNWNHMKKHFEKKIFLQAVGEMALGKRKQELQNGKKPPLQREILVQGRGSAALLPSTWRITVSAESKQMANQKTYWSVLKVDQASRGRPRRKGVVWWPTVVLKGYQLCNFSQREPSKVCYSHEWALEAWPLLYAA